MRTPPALPRLLGGAVYWLYFSKRQPSYYTPTREEANGQNPNLFLPVRRTAGGVSTLCQKNWEAVFEVTVLRLMGHGKVSKSNQKRPSLTFVEEETSVMYTYRKTTYRPFVCAIRVIFGFLTLTKKIPITNVGYPRMFGRIFGKRKKWSKSIIVPSGNKCATFRNQ